MVQVVFLDANIFLEIALNDKKSEECKKLLDEVLRGKIKAYTSDFIVYSCLLQIQFKTKETKQMRNFILFINSIDNLTILRPSLFDMEKAVEYKEKWKLDFDDSLVISCMVNNGIKTLISLDSDFNKIPLIIKRIP